MCTATPIRVLPFRNAVWLVAAVLLLAASTPLDAESTILLDFEDTASWQKGNAKNATLSTESVDGQAGHAIRLRYDLIRDHWVEIGRTVQLDWKRVDAFHLYMRGDANGSVFEMKLKDADGSYYGLKLPITGLAPDRWTRITIPFRDCHYLWGGDSKLDTVETIWFAVSRGLKRAGFLDIDEFSFSTRQIGSPVLQIHASQIGYHPWDNKKFVVRAADVQGNPALNGTFRVVKLGTDWVVHEGSLTPSPFNQWEGRFFTGDFTPLRAPGAYQIQIEIRDEKSGAPASWSAVSYPFVIEDRVLANRTAKIQYHYVRFMRCGIICHKDDPVPGGYHDTQMDLSKRMWSIPHLIMGLARFTARSPVRFDVDTDGIDDVEDELKFGLKFITEMPEPDGTVSWGGIEADFKKLMSYEDFIARLGPLKREEDTIPRIKYLDKHFHGTGFNLVALLEAADGVRKTDPALSDRAVAVARRAWEWMNTQPMDKAHDYGVYLYAASELNHRFPSERFLARMDTAVNKMLELQSLDPAPIANGAVGNFFYSPSERDFHFQYKFTSFNVAIHLALIRLEEDLPRTHPLWPKIRYANQVFARYYLPVMSAATPYGQIAHGLEPDTSGIFHPKHFAGKAGERAAASFHGLNCDHFGYAYVAMKYAQLTGDLGLENFADDQAQWALGKNPLGYCMMTGAGSLNPVHMSAFFDKGPIVGEIPNGIVSGNEKTEEPEWWGEGPSSGEDWMPHNSYYLSLIPELDRDAGLSLRVTRNGKLASGTVAVVREDGETVASLKLEDGVAVPVSLTPQARHSVVLTVDGVTRVRNVEAVSGRRVFLSYDFDRDLSLDISLPPDMENLREVQATVTAANHSEQPVEFSPRVIAVGCDVVSGLPEKLSVPPNANVTRAVTVRVHGGRPALLRIEDPQNADVFGEKMWMPKLPALPGVAEAVLTIDDMADVSKWKTENEKGAVIEARADNGALKITYDMGTGRWIQVKKDISKNISAYNTLKFRFKGEGTANDLQVKLEDASGANVGKTFGGSTSSNEWKEIAVPFKELTYWWGGKKKFDWEKLARVFIAVSKSGGGKGQIWVDDVRLENTAAAPSEQITPQKSFDYVTGDAEVARKAAQWISSMQQKSGLILSYEGDHRPFAWTYDQGISLIVLAHENRPAAEKLLDALKRLQKPDGYWNDGYMLDTGEAYELSADDQKKWFRSDVPGVRYEYDNQWIGSASWVVLGIQRYAEITGDRKYDEMMKKGAWWLATQQKPDGRLHDVTEGNMTSWHAMKNAGMYLESTRVRDYLLYKVWNKDESRFQVSPDNAQVYLDVQTWGASFAAAAGFPDFGLKSLAFARKKLECKSVDGTVKGFDATGPYSVWNEGTLQYIVAGGVGAADYLKEMNKQQRADGALQHSRENLEKGGAWHTAMYGVCPTAWLYFANIGAEPFSRKGE